MLWRRRAALSGRPWISTIRWGGTRRPVFATSLFNLAQLYQRTNRYAKAQPLFQEALDIRTRFFGPEHHDAIQTRLSLAVVHAQLGDHNQALAEAEQVAGTNPGGSDLLYELARVYAASGCVALRDEQLSPPEQERKAEQAITRALALLARARAEGFFTNPVWIEELRKDSAFDSVRSREDFKDFLNGLGRKPDPGQSSVRQEGEPCETFCPSFPSSCWDGVKEPAAFVAPPASACQEAGRAAEIGSPVGSQQTKTARPGSLPETPVPPEGSSLKSSPIHQV